MSAASPRSAWSSNAAVARSSPVDEKRQVWFGLVAKDEMEAAIRGPLDIDEVAVDRAAKGDSAVRRGEPVRAELQGDRDPAVARLAGEARA